MSSVTVKLPEALQERLEQIAQEYGVSVPDLLVDAAEKLSQSNTLEKIKIQAATRDTRGAFDRVLAAVPDVEPSHADDVIR
jgi:predicted transcriptional regulator